jgi:hypothetical protein
VRAKVKAKVRDGWRRPEAVRYYIDQSTLEPDDTLAVYQAALGWAIARANRFRMSLHHGIYDQPGDEERLRGFGMSESIDNVSRPLRRPEAVVRVTGKPSQELALELTTKRAPAKATAGDLCPAEDLELFLENRLLFGCYDYGRDLLFDLMEDEREELSSRLKEKGLEPEIVLLIWGKRP